MSDSAQSRRLFDQPTTIPKALGDMRKGRQLPAAELRWLKAEGFLAGDLTSPTLTAKGRRILGANIARNGASPTDPKPDEPKVTAHDGPMRIPDALERLANPRKGDCLLLEPSDIAAARRFQSDLERAGLRQRITQSWSLSALSHGGSTGRGNSSGRHEPVAMLDAQDRVQKACKSLGPEFADLLIDLCLFEKTLTGVENERQWPKRSAKLAVALALHALARHYGLNRTAQGLCHPA